jgi:phage-related protein
MKANFNISGWREDYSYEKYDVVFFTGDSKNSTTGCLQIQSGYYYAENSQAGAGGGYDETVATQSPSGVSTKWTRSFPSTPSYGSNVTFTAHNDRIDFGDGYYKLTPKSHNNIDVKYDLKFSSRTDKEAKAIIHFLGHRFETPYSGAQRTDDGVQTLTGFNFTPFAPYNQTGLFHCDALNHSCRFTNVNDVDAEFIDDTNTAINWKNRIINLDNTSGFWEASIAYSKFDIVYYSGHNVANHSGYYYYSGDTPTTSSQVNKPEAGATVWTKDDFFFKPTMAANAQSPRSLKAGLANEYTQRYSDGLNSNLLDFNLSFDGRDNREAKALVHFLINKQGYESFKFTAPRPYEQQTKYFVCSEWNDNVVFEENRRISASFKEFPLNLFQQARMFETYVFDASGSVIAASEGFDPPDGRDVYFANFGNFMTGFSSGSGFYLVNSGTQAIVSDMYLSGESNTTGLYKFKTNDNPGFQIIDGPATHARYALNKFESGFFEVEFATTGKSSLIGSNAGLGLEKGITFYEQGHQGAGYPGPYYKPSQLYITTTDEFGFDDPSGTLKVDISGNAEAFAPGPITDFTVASDSTSNFLITGGWKFSEPFTATGVLLEVSGIPDTLSTDKDTATGVLEDFNPYGADHKNFYLQPLKNNGVNLRYAGGNSTTLPDLGGAFYFYGKPGKTYYFRIRSQNIDVIGGNINGGTERGVLSTDFVKASASPQNEHFNVYVNEDNAVNYKYTQGRTPFEFNFPADRYGRTMLANVNLSEFASGALLETRSAVSNDNRVGDIDDINMESFSKVVFHFGPSVTAFSADPTKPAVQTGPVIHGATDLPIEIRIPSSANIIGAGGSGAHAASEGNVSPASFSVVSSQISQMGAGNDGRSASRLGSVIELAGIGPLGNWATRGKLDGNYFTPNGAGESDNVSPSNGEDGGTALHIDSTYNGVKVRIYNVGFIGGGGGGGGAGGTRMSNIANMSKAMDPDAPGVVPGKLYISKLNLPGTFTIPTPDTHDGPIVARDKRLLQHKTVFEDYGESGGGFHRKIRAIRPGGGGGGGCGFRVRLNSNTFFNYDQEAQPPLSIDYVETSSAVGEDGMEILIPVAYSATPAIGGRGAKPRFFDKGVSHGGSKAPKCYVNEPSANGQPSQFTVGSQINNSKASHGGYGGAGAKSEDPDAQRGFYVVNSPSGLRVLAPTKKESAYNGGGHGGGGGKWGQDGANGEHPVQNYMDRYINKEYGPEPRNFGYGGSGGLCIETNGAKLEFLPTGFRGPAAIDDTYGIPNSGTDDRSQEDAKSSYLYRNIPGVGGYLTAKHTDFDTKVANDPMPIGLVSGLQPRRMKSTDKFQRVAAFTIDTPTAYNEDGDIHAHDDYRGPSFEGCDRKTPNSSNAVSDTVSGQGKLPWKAFNRVINGNFDNYAMLDRGGFPYYLIYDFGIDNEVVVNSVSITSAGASLSYFTDANQKELFGEVYSMTDFELRATNAAPDEQGTYTKSLDSGDPTIAEHMLDKNTDLIFAITDEGWRDAGEEQGQINPGHAGNIKNIRRPFAYVAPRSENYSSIKLIKDNPGEAFTIEKYSSTGEVEGDRFNKYICVPGLTRQWDLTPYLTQVENIGGGPAKFYTNRKVKKYRYYILKILAADNFPGKRVKFRGYKKTFPWPDRGKCKIADLGFRGYNQHYAGFISVR